MAAGSPIYTLGPFSIVSELPLPELLTSSFDGLPVQIRIGVVPQFILSPTFETANCIASRNEFLLKIPGIASYHICDGAEVIIQPAAGSSELDIRGYLLGNMFAVLCHQRRLLPLHASAVKMGAGAIAFLGDSGAGKSTLAGFLASRGYPLVADDICLLDPDSATDERVIPVAPWLKLWRSSLDALGQGTSGLSQTFTDQDKFRVPALSYVAVEQARIPLNAIVILKKQSEDSPGGTTLRPLSPAKSLVEAMHFTYQRYLLEWLGLEKEHFARCGLAISGSRAFEWIRPWGFEELEGAFELLATEFGKPADSGSMLKP
jgi:hypothetical protein